MEGLSGRVSGGPRGGPRLPKAFKTPRFSRSSPVVSSKSVQRSKGLCLRSRFACPISWYLLKFEEGNGTCLLKVHRVSLSLRSLGSGSKQSLVMLNNLTNQPECFRNNSSKNMPQNEGLRLGIPDFLTSVDRQYPNRGRGNSRNQAHYTLRNRVRRSRCIEHPDPSC